MERIVLAYSGSDDDSEAIPLLADEYGSEIVTLTLDVGQDQELEEVRDHSLAAGAVRAHVLDARRSSRMSSCCPLCRRARLDDGREPTTLPLAHALIGKKLVEMAAIEEATAAHRGRGHDCDAHRKQCPSAEPESSRPLVGRSRRACEDAHSTWGSSRRLRRVREGPAEAMLSWTKSPEAAPDTGADLELDFERGVPTAVNGVPLDLSELIESLSIIAGQHGVGRIASPNETGGRIRRLYEAPAAIVLHAAHAALESADWRLCRDVAEAAHSPGIPPELIVHGLWFTPLRARSTPSTPSFSPR